MNVYSVTKLNSLELLRQTLIYGENLMCAAIKIRFL